MHVSDALEVLSMLIDQIHAGGMQLLQEPEPMTIDSTNPTAAIEDFQLLLQLSLHVIHLISRLDSDEKQKFEYHRLVHSLINLDPRGQEHESLLHLAVDPKISMTSDEFYSPFPSLAVVQTLLYCGAQINSTDKKKNTPLHYSIKFLTYTELHNEGILECLLKNGAHVDMYNSEGVSALQLMMSQGLPVCPMQYRTLKCLASEVIMKNSIPYETEVPVSLLPFIKMHGN